MNPPTGTDGGLWCPTVRRIFKRLCMGHELHDGPVGGEMDTEKKCFVGTEACPVTVRGVDPRILPGWRVSHHREPRGKYTGHLRISTLAGPGVRRARGLASEAVRIVLQKHSKKSKRDIFNDLEVQTGGSEGGWH